VDASWERFLRTPQASEHAVQVYGDADELAASVADYVAAGFARGEPAVLVVTREHRQRFQRALRARGLNLAELSIFGLLTVADARDVLARFMSADRPSAARFEAAVGTMIDEVAARFPDKTVRAFGEMVDVLCRRGLPEAAAVLEGYWTDLAYTRRFSLLCGYRCDSLREDGLQAVTDAHTHALVA